MNRKPYIVGISGGSASGKTYLLRHLKERLPEEKVTFISQDHYYIDAKDQELTEDGLINYDRPQAIMLDRLETDIRKLINGEDVSIRKYTFNNPAIAPGTMHFASRPIIIIEGLFVFHEKRIADLMDLKLFVEATEYIRLARRIKRDHEERGLNLEAVLRDYLRFVGPMYTRYIEPTKDICDFIIPNNDKMDKGVEIIANHLEGVLKENRNLS